jgi:hypothetical protein
MALTFHDLKNLLIREDEVTVLELLEISSEDLVERFADLIEERYELLEEAFSEELVGDEEEDEERGREWPQD